MGKAFRFNRWKAAQEEKQRKAEASRKAAHAKKRAGSGNLDIGHRWIFGLNAA
ncbi:hypothetical protein HDIA_P0019 (plasmid) [Hartmannibacter diazotrophicus]|uniref:Uncharacterized protein n=1 Tax=Hartmannibacter diazotrophicus TaxID=1482074 RepID=A0A2C9DE50_9HYPH|nr:hypothetical protein [Hartmannibacter diazotrophicus]SON58428.1 hypothetical protein HDIA_P0019 [Hartmannibacter diazotrophicus]